MYRKKLKTIPRLLHKATRESLIRSYPTYQPIIKNGKFVTKGDRDCLDRWELIEKEIKSSEGKTLIDIGCAEGFYVLQAAQKCGCFSIGVDADIRRIMMAQHQLAEEKIQPAGFVFAEVDEQFLGKLQKFDFVIFMSVMHHIMSQFGEAYALKILKKLKDITGKGLIFEMGQSDEIKNNWAAKLPNMGPDPHRWIADFIRSAGWSEVTKIGTSDSYKGDISRAIFIAKP